MHVIIDYIVSEQLRTDWWIMTAWKRSAVAMMCVLLNTCDTMIGFQHPPSFPAPISFFLGTQHLRRLVGGGAPSTILQSRMHYAWNEDDGRRIGLCRNSVQFQIQGVKYWYSLSDFSPSSLPRQIYSRGALPFL